RHGPGGPVLLVPARRERMGRPALAPVVDPGEGDLRGVPAGGLVDQVSLAARVALAAVVPESDAHLRGAALEGPGAPAEALRPEVLWLVAPTRDRPVLDHRLPGPSFARRDLDLILH